MLVDTLQFMPIFIYSMIVDGDMITNEAYTAKTNLRSCLRNEDCNHQPSHTGKGHFAHWALHHMLYNCLPGRTYRPRNRSHYLLLRIHKLPCDVRGGRAGFGPGRAHIRGHCDPCEIK